MSAVEMVADEGELFELLDQEMNEKGLAPEVVAYDPLGRPHLLWLNEEGGDSVYLVATRLQGEDSARSEPVDIDPKDLAYPLRVVRPTGAQPRVLPSVEKVARTVNVALREAWRDDYSIQSVVDAVTRPVLALFSEQPTAAEVRKQVAEEIAQAIDDTHSGGISRASVIRLGAFTQAAEIARRIGGAS